jgi:hypothetical protein
MALRAEADFPTGQGSLFVHLVAALTQAASDPFTRTARAVADGA